MVGYQGSQPMRGHPAGSTAEAAVPPRQAMPLTEVHRRETPTQSSLLPVSGTVIALALKVLGHSSISS